jgi:homospermidine synthase
MKQEKRHANFTGRLVMLGFGSIGQAVLALLQRHLGINGNRVTIVKTSEDKSGIAAEFGAQVRATPLDEGNFETVLEPLVGEGDRALRVSPMR